MLRYRGPGTWEDKNNENPREIRFIAPKVVNSKSAKGAVDSDGNWNDPWGHQYLIFIDNDYDGTITISSLDINKVGDEGQVDVSVGAASVGFFFGSKGTGIPDMNTPLAQKTVLLSWQ